MKLNFTELYYLSVIDQLITESTLPTVAGVCRRLRNLTEGRIGGKRLQYRVFDRLEKKNLIERVERSPTASMGNHLRTSYFLTLEGKEILKDHTEIASRIFQKRTQP